VRRLADEVQVDQASFFMLVPIPGSRDHLEMVLRGERLDPAGIMNPGKLLPG